MLKTNPPAKAQVMANKTVCDVQGRCPKATQDIAENTKNRNWTIKEYAYGPMNPDAANPEFWHQKADLFNTTVEEARTALCGNCAAFDQTDPLLECMAKGLEDKNELTDPWRLIQAGNLGYCQLFHFKCAGSRTCDAWVHGGPLRGC